MGAPWEKGLAKLQKEEKLKRRPHPYTKHRRPVQEQDNMYAKKYRTGSERRKTHLENPHGAL
jgi:hypothetical protein